MKHIIAFVAGATLGSLATYLIVRKKYEQIAQEEIDSVKELYAKKKTKKEDSDEEQDIQVDEDEVDEYKGAIETLGYDYSDISKKASNHKKTERPYVIRPEEYGDMDGYETISLTHYSDGVLTDDADEVIPDDEIDDIVGSDYAEHFGEYEDDSVHVRNDRLKCDYEILLDLRKYQGVHNTGYPKGSIN